MVKITFIEDDSLIPKKLTNDNTAIINIAEIKTGAPNKSAKYPPKPNAIVDAEIIATNNVSQPTINATKLFLNAFFTKEYSAAAFGYIEESSA